MAREPKSFVIGTVMTQVDDDPDLSWVRNSATTAVPSKFRAAVRLSDPDLLVLLAIRVDQGGRARVVDLRVEVDQRDEAITTSMLRRVLVDPMLRAALRSVSRTTVERSDVRPGGFTVQGQGAHVSFSVPAGMDERVLRAAQLYTEARASGSRAPTEAVAAAMGYSRAQVSRFIRAARESNPPLLGPVDEEPADPT